MLWLWPSRERAEIKNDFSTFWTLKHDFSTFWTLKHGFSIFWTLKHGFSTFWPRPGIWLKSRSVGDPDPVTPLVNSGGLQGGFDPNKTRRAYQGRSI